MVLPYHAGIQQRSKQPDPATGRQASERNLPQTLICKDLKSCGSSIGCIYLLCISRPSQLVEEPIWLLPSNFALAVQDRIQRRPTCAYPPNTSPLCPLATLDSTDAQLLHSPFCVVLYPADLTLAETCRGCCVLWLSNCAGLVSSQATGSTNGRSMMADWQNSAIPILAGIQLGPRNAITTTLTYPTSNGTKA